MPLILAHTPAIHEAPPSDGKALRIAQETLAAHVRILADEIGERNIFRPAALQAAADYIAETWRRQGYTVDTQPYTARGAPCANLEVVRPGKQRPKEILLIGAHYDSVRGSPGANDNGSGVAALLEISRQFALLEPAMTVRFVAFVNEEPPFFFRKEMGSLVYAKAAKRRGDDIRLMISLEMLGCYQDTPGSQHYPPLFRRFYPERGNFVAFVSNFRSRGMMRDTVAAFRSVSHFPAESLATFSWIPGVAWSDHDAFWRQGYRALMVTDTAFYRYPYYHTAEDTPDKLNYPAFARVATALSRTFAALSTR
ncbi:MAG TPA: aminopeptidase [Betaproteobacteria bacterium]|nr:aminopeptidase [Betaproteobacteria bacterium]